MYPNTRNVLLYLLIAWAITSAFACGIKQILLKIRVIIDNLVNESPLVGSIPIVRRSESWKSFNFIDFNDS